MNEDKQEQQPSRSAKKRAARAVEETAAQLVELGEADFKRLPLAGGIRQALEETRGIKAHGARKRQLKFLAGLLRRDPDTQEALEAFLAEQALARSRETAGFHRLEAMRERLCDPARCEAALEELQPCLSAADLAKTRRLARSVQQHNDRRAFRELFRLLKTIRDED